MSAIIPFLPFCRNGGHGDDMPRNNSAQGSGDKSALGHAISSLCHSTASLLRVPSRKSGRDAAAKEHVPSIFARYCNWPASDAGSTAASSAGVASSAGAASSADVASGAGAASSSDNGESALMGVEGFCEFRKKYQGHPCLQITKIGGGSTPLCADCSAIFHANDCLSAGMPMKLFAEFYAAFQESMSTGDCTAELHYSKTVRVVLSCEDLISRDVIGESDPLVIIYYRPSGSEEWTLGAQSKFQNNERNPSFEALQFSMFGFDEPSLETAELRIDVFDKDLIGKNPIGRFVTTAADLASLKETKEKRLLEDFRSTGAWWQRSNPSENFVGFIRVDCFLAHAAVRLTPVGPI